MEEPNPEKQVGEKQKKGLSIISNINDRRGFTVKSRRTPCSIIAILSALRAVDRRCVMKMTVFVFLPVPLRPSLPERQISSSVSNILRCACESRDEVYHVHRASRKISGSVTLRAGQTPETHRFIKEDEVDFRPVGTHEGACEGDALPLNQRSQPCKSNNVANVRISNLTVLAP